MTVAQFVETAVGQTAIMAAVLNLFLVALWFLKATRPEGVGRHWAVIVVAHILALAAGLRLATHRFPAGPVLDRYGSDTYYYALVLALALLTMQFFALIICWIVDATQHVWQEYEDKSSNDRVYPDVPDKQNPYLVL